MTNNPGPDLAQLIQEAEQVGIVTAEQVCANLEALILNQYYYLVRRRRQGIFTSHNQEAYRQMLVAAKAIQLLQQQKGETHDA